MAWYDEALKIYDNVTDSASDLVSEYIGAEKDRVSEEIRNPVVTTEKIQQPQTLEKTHAGSGINWQVAGVVVGGLGVLLTLYKLAK